MNKKTIISLLGALLILAFLVYWFVNRDKKVEVETPTNNTTVEQTTNSEVSETTVEATKLGLGEYGDLASYVRTDLTGADKKKLQAILNEREEVRAKYQTMVNMAKATPNATSAMVEKAMNDMQVAMAKFDDRLSIYMTTEMYEAYTKTTMEKAEQASKDAMYAK